MTSTLPAVLSIAGSDSSGGAGIQADLKTMLMNGVFGMSAITALVAENTLGVQAVANTDPEMLAEQIDSVFADIPPAAVKIGMIPNVALVEVIAERLLAHHAKHIVLDPVMVAASGAALSDAPTVNSMRERLFPIAEVITPNIPEAEVITGAPIRGKQGMESAARQIVQRYQCSALVKGGHGVEDADDVLCTPGGTITWFKAKRIDNPNTHGTGCTLSSAIASNLAKDESLPESIQHAKDYLTGALQAMLDLGSGCGPMDHAWALREPSVMLGEVAAFTATSDPATALRSAQDDG